ncbi:efflux RND transporter periplasmic adaptor subunit [Sinorhizobium meliloti]|uniref:efflux RND transporter periplasmic adaptor subunit n=1 Tax=Rhizobium meliloti TaxID=382 RepID=UPI003D65614C
MTQGSPADDCPSPVARSKRCRVIVALCIAGAIGLAALIAALASGASHGTKTEAAQPTLPKVTVVTAARRDMAHEVFVNGVIAAVNEVSVGTTLSDQAISGVYAEIGDQVTAGQVLARLDTRTLTARVEQARAVLLKARAALADATAANDEAQTNLRRVESLAGASVVSRQEADARRATALRAAAAVQTAEADIAAARAQLAEAEIDLDRTVIKAPVDGVVSARSARIGALANGSTPLFQIIANNNLELLAEIPERDLPGLAVGQAVSLQVNGFAASIEGRIRLIEPKIGERSRIGIVHIQLPRRDDLRAGAFATGRAVVDRRAVQVAVPLSAIRTAANGEGSVLRVDEGNRVAIRSVRLGLRSGGYVEVVEGLAVGDRIVATAGAFLKPGTIVAPVPQAAMADAEARP